MTNPNVDFYRSWINLTKKNNEETQENLQTAMLKFEFSDSNFEVMTKAYARLHTSNEMLEKLMSQIEDYEERIALLQ